MGSVGLPKFEVFGEYSNVIDGKLSGTEQTRQGINPATAKPLADVPVSTQEDVDRAVAAARKAFESWSKTKHADRVKAVKAFADGLAEHAEQMAQLLTREQGKPLPMAKMETAKASSYAHTTADLKWDEDIISEDEEKQIILRYTPLGVVVGIVPWNFPLFLAMVKIIPAVLTGNTIIIKPSPFTPYCGLKLVELAQQYFPPGVVQSLSGGDNLGPMLTAHPGPDKISFTGSSATGKKVMESAAKTLKRVTLELGGNDPAIVCANVDIAKVAPQITSLAFLNSGQICLAIKRIFIHESIFEEFRAAMIEHAKTIKVGEGNEEGVFMGPINNEMQYNRVKGFFADIEKEKWNVAFGGKNDDKPGYFINPTIIDRPADDSRIVAEEPFGPIVPILSWSTEEEVLARANNTKMGLGASVWSNDLEQANRMARQVDAGTVWINTHLELDDAAPFGGHKESGIGFEFGVGGLRQYCNTQSLIAKKV